jgi:hypothetical protein
MGVVPAFVFGGQEGARAVEIDAREGSGAGFDNEFERLVRLGTSLEGSLACLGQESAQTLTSFAGRLLEATRQIILQ